MTQETIAMQELAIGFGTEWYATDDPAERQQLVRSYLLTLVFIAESHLDDEALLVDEAAMAAYGIDATGAGRRRADRLIMGGVETVRPREPWPDTPLALLQSFAAHERKYRHRMWGRESADTSS